MNAKAVQVQTDPLFEEGARSYPRALVALSTFARKIQEVCCDAMKRHLDDLSGALGLPLESAQVKEHANPSRVDSEDANGKWALLGTLIKRPNNNGVSLWSYVWWDESGPHVCVSIEFYDDKGAFEQAWAAVRSLGVHAYEKEIYLSRDLKPEDFARLPAILDELNRDWIASWRKAGGVGQFLGKR